MFRKDEEELYFLNSLTRPPIYLFKRTGEDADLLDALTLDILSSNLRASRPLFSFVSG